MENIKNITTSAENLDAKFDKLKNEEFADRVKLYDEVYREKYGWDFNEMERGSSSGKTSKGEQVELDYRKYDTKDENNTSTPLFYNLIESNSDNEIVGSSQFFIYKKSQTICRRIRVDKKFKGKSYAGPMLEFGENLLINLSKEERFADIREQVDNENYDTLVGYLQSVVNGIAEYDEVKIKKIIDEQVRWQKIFVEKYSNHPDLEIAEIKYKTIPNLTEFLSKAKNPDEDIVETGAFENAVAIEGMLDGIFQDHKEFLNEEGRLKVPTTIYLKPKKKEELTNPFVNSKHDTKSNIAT